MVTYIDNFDGYVVEEYVGSDGPGSWYQESSPPDMGEFRIMSVDGETVYALSMKSNLGFAESIIYYYLPIPFTGIIYLGPSNHTFSAAVKTTAIGGLIFRVQPVRVDDKYRFWKFYSATINKAHKKLSELSRIAAQPFSAIPELAVLVSGVIASFLIGVIYLFPILTAAVLLWKWRQKRLPSLRPRIMLSALLLGLMVGRGCRDTFVDRADDHGFGADGDILRSLGAASAAAILEHVLDQRRG